MACSARPTRARAARKLRDIRVVQRRAHICLMVDALRAHSQRLRGIGFDQVESYAALCREMGWHLQFLATGGSCPNSHRGCQNCRCDS